MRARGLRIVRGGRRGVVVVDGLDLEVLAAQVVGLLGPSGGGKTSLLRAIVGVQQDVSGTLEVLGLPAGDPRLRRRIGYMTQSPSVYADLTVRENLRYFARVVGLGADVREDRVSRVLHDVDLHRLSGRAVGGLSGGERARTSLAIALLGQPDLLVLDEPTVGLDPVLRRDLWALFHGLAANGASLLVSSHVMDEAERCDRLLLLHGGRVLADSTPAAMLAATGTATAEAAFLALVEGGAR
ncbi:multidrug ABC transporter ATPase [Actinotalea ferrariae CF5-4]|uniref:Multidrug ABC transporter ATPase n=1 Tax=Actinotalea ferrariae CF5-4 TaxID=948458 RepID=A0A021VSL1_9CELL|nr:ABC transporter ATP-binding protein [Actinotalea ferrariae]EYR64113.1 multidrug ABC transporter ATPase [Actinotalea ferrariae CF5-4]